MKKGDILSFQSNDIADKLPYGTIFRVLDHLPNYINFEGALLMKVKYIDDNHKERTLYTPIYLKDSHKEEHRHIHEGMQLNSINAWKVEIVKIPIHNNGKK